jgi:Flp pilus assembly protein TadG
MVEFALILIPILLLLLGAIQFGVIWAAQVGVTNAVRDAARAASGVQPKSNSAGLIDSTSEGSYANSVNTTVLTPGLSKNVPFFAPSSVTVQKVCYTTFSDAAPVPAPALNATVTVTYGHSIFIPLLSAILGPTISTTTTLSIPVGLDLPYSLPSVGSSAGTSGC